MRLAVTPPRQFRAASSKRGRAGFDQAIVCPVADFKRLELDEFGLGLLLRRFGVLDLAQQL